jgi:predicted small secreted protein
MMLHKLMLVVCAFLFAGCAKVQGAYSDYQDGQEMRYVSQAKTACGRFGFTPGTDAFASCVDKNMNAEKDRDALKIAAFHSDSKK